MVISPKSLENRTTLPNRQFWVAWSIALTVVFVVHLITLTISPPVWRDEVQNIEYGRFLLEPHTDWSINWSVRTDKPIFLLSYLGPMLQELALRASNLSMVGPRAASLLGGMIAATAALGWLLSRQTPKRAAWLLSLIFLLDPLFVQSYRGARLDCWVLALCFGSCWMLRRSMSRIQKGQSSEWLVTLAGSLAAVAIFVWPSAVLLYPLVILEFTEAVWRTQALRRDWKTTLSQIIAFTFGGVITATFLVIPIWQQLIPAFRDLQMLSGTQQPLLSRFIALLDSFKLSPFLPILAIVGVVYWREKWLVIATLFATTLVLSTQTYVHRIIYLLPYIIGLISSIYQASFENTLKTTRRWIGYRILIFILTWSIILSLIIRPAIALSQKEVRNPSILHNAAVSSIGAGDHKVFLDALEFYYVGRSLGWRMFFPLGGGGDYVFLKQSNDLEFRQFLSRVDYAIFLQENINIKMIERIEKAGLRYQKILDYVPKNKVEGKLKSFGGGQPYDQPYMLFLRSRGL